MAKALKPIVFVLLLLSIVSLILGFLLFGKREVYKESTAKSRSALSEIARNLKFDDFRASDLVVTDPAQFPQMDKSLNLLAAAAQLKTDELETTQQALDVSREERDQARDEANRAIADREAAEDEAARLNQEVAAKSAEVTRQQARLDELQQDKVDLQLQTDELNTKLATVEDELRDVQDQLVTLADAQAVGVAELVVTGMPRTGQAEGVRPAWWPWITWTSPSTTERSASSWARRVRGSRRCCTASAASNP